MKMVAALPDELEFDVNGKHCRVSVPSAASLLMALRHELELRGTRHGCTTGHCGACTVLIDGRPVTSCTTPVEAAAGRQVSTIEGLELDAAGKHLIAAFMTEQAGQCGYCLPGILMRARALLSANPTPSRTEIAAALDENLCRCGAHQRILNAIERAASDMSGEQAV